MLFFFFFNDTATTEIYTLSLHDALPIYPYRERKRVITTALDFPTIPYQWLVKPDVEVVILPSYDGIGVDRKSTRLNSSHANISYAVFCLKKKKKQNNINQQTQNTRYHYH